MMLFTYEAKEEHRKSPLQFVMKASEPKMYTFHLNIFWLSRLYCSSVLSEGIST